MNKFSASTIVLPNPAPNLQAKIWSSLEAELSPKPIFGLVGWQKWVLGSFTSVLLISLVATKLIINQATKNQFNDLDRELALTEQAMSSETINLEWESAPLESN